jgi:hypothetical protein
MIDPLFKNIADKFKQLFLRWETLESEVHNSRGKILTCVTLAERVNQYFIESEKETIYNLIISIYLESLVSLEKGLREIKAQQIVEEIFKEKNIGIKTSKKQELK